ncbi:bifunctional DNA-binding transcriptional regulator/O6-methylguanine-DNA methyltransferase Ada [Chelatococcus sambhunathii]|uniref:Bifunctional DNA-binding transcriptional regulator/O6-methylguanine-DNA methyltransferase Ada n=1 Tax=Chelatococcus sambhunathii TaxID=363953 RepID=A0ABU1DJD7_9HYPH|nr:bifunctional DNA-binding transcriptional regulator/O6-methylguanine-DNA methyltransferase Ada [Chelatococcus sambhunathii]MDR4308237.1 bifunctional DNA-binding transcriptional regulator/O6-methylguanine-DNA methyltransferase Ada [Chelatococcus sambhunathii]
MQEAPTDRPAISTERDPRWAAVVAKDARADGTFFTCVRSTGIYCRPSCPARRPKPENVSFAETWEEAEARGFRACKRCRPKEASLAERQAALIADLCRHIEQAEDAPKLDELAKRAGVSPFHLHRLFKAATGLTPKAYASAERAKRARVELASGEGSVTSAIYGSGFNSNGRFYAASDGMFGMTPSAFKAGGAGKTIRYAVGLSTLGRVLVGSSDRGVCFIALGDDEEALLADLRRRFGKAEIVRGDGAYEETVRQVVASVEDPRRGFDLPLDIQGTAFQQRVWRALQAIPLGETASYAEIARAIGAPTSARAVAQACGANKLAVVVPCHRVVREDGALSGYRWGVERKRALLKKEKAG